MKTIVLIMAMHEEAKPIIEKLELKENSESLRKIPTSIPINIYSNNLTNAKIHLIINQKCKRHGVDRVGTQPAGLLSYFACEYLSPDLIISVGTAGGDKNTHTIGQVVLNKDYFFYHDRYIPLPKFDEYGYGLYPCSSIASVIASELNIEQAIIATGNALINTQRDFEILKKFNASVKEMEVASIADVAEFYKVPVLAIKGITDYYNSEQSAEQFLQNFQKTVQNLSDKTDEVIKYCITKI